MSQPSLLALLSPPELLSLPLELLLPLSPLGPPVGAFSVARDLPSLSLARVEYSRFKVSTSATPVCSGR